VQDASPHLLGRGGCKDSTCDGAAEQAGAHEGREGGFVARAAAGDDADLWAGRGGVDYLVLDVAVDGGVGVGDALQSGGDEVGGVVDEVFC
jgi:hypothetical protein